MTDVDRAWSFLLASFPDWILQQRTRDAWTQSLLEDHEPQDLLAGARTLAKSCRYRKPLLAEWLEHATRAKRARLAPPPDAGEVERAWIARHSMLGRIDVPMLGPISVRGVDMPYPGYEAARRELMQNES